MAPPSRKALKRVWPTRGGASSRSRSQASRLNQSLGLSARNGLRVPKPTTVGEAWEAWYAGARSGAITNRSGDPYKSSAGRRKVPISAMLRGFLRDQLATTGRAGSDRFFGATTTRPFNGEKLTERADEAWKSAGLNRITLHECRHTFASLMIAAGVNAKALSTFMGHANISITLDRYGRLMPGSETRRPNSSTPTSPLSASAPNRVSAAAPHRRTGAPTGARDLNASENPL